MVSCQSILGKFTKLGSWNKPAQGMGSFPCGDLERIENQRKIHSFPQAPPAGRNAPARLVYNCAIFQRGSPRADALEASQGRSQSVSFASKLPFPAKIRSMSWRVLS